MLYWSAIFLGIALACAILGFGGVTAALSGIAQILFIVFAVVAVVSLVLCFARQET